MNNQVLLHSVAVTYETMHDNLVSSVEKMQMKTFLSNQSITLMHNFSNAMVAKLYW